MIRIKNTDQIPENAVLVKKVLVDNEDKSIEEYEFEVYFQGDAEADSLIGFHAEMIAIEKSAIRKRERDIEIQSLIVTTSSGNSYNADETSQMRITKAISGLTGNETIDWTMSDNTVVAVNRIELTEALRLAIQAQTIIWQKNYGT